MSKTKRIDVTLTLGELQQLTEVIGNGYGDGDWNDIIDSVEDNPGVAKRQLMSGWNKLIAAENALRNSS